MTQIKAGRDINNAPNGNIRTENVAKKSRDSFFIKIVKWVMANVITIIIGLIVAYVSFSMHWK
jgi:hypothetical protein